MVEIGSCLLSKMDGRSKKYCKNAFNKKRLQLLQFGSRFYFDMDVSENRGIPKWMVKIMENPIKMDDLGGKIQHFRKPPYNLVKRQEANGTSDGRASVPSTLEASAFC